MLLLLVVMLLAERPRRGAQRSVGGKNDLEDFVERSMRLFACEVMPAGDLAPAGGRGR